MESIYIVPVGWNGKNYIAADVMIIAFPVDLCQGWVCGGNETRCLI